MVVNVIEEGDLSVAHRPSILQLLGNAMARNFYGGDVGAGYLALEG